MRIDLEKIPPEGLELQENEPAGIIDVKDSDVIIDTPISISVSANLVSGTLLIKGRIKTEAEFNCSRCLKHFNQVLVNRDFGFDLDVRGKKEVDITENIREAVILQFPVKPLCGPDCRGLCPKCGRDLNEKECGCDRSPEDIRWQELDNLKIKTRGKRKK